MATAQEKMEALVYWVGGSILTVTMALMGTPIWATIIGILNSFQMVGSAAQQNLHAVQPIPMAYYGFLICFEIALIIRTVFVVWSRTTYETSF